MIPEQSQLAGPLPVMRSTKFDARFGLTDPLLIIYDGSAQPLPIRWAMLTRIADDDLRFFFGKVLVYMPKDKLLERLVIARLLQQNVNVLPVMREKPTNSVAVFLSYPTAIAGSKLAKRSKEAVPVFQMRGISVSLRRLTGAARFCFFGAVALCPKPQDKNATEHE